MLNVAFAPIISLRLTEARNTGETQMVNLYVNTELVGSVAGRAGVKAYMLAHNLTVAFAVDSRDGAAFNVSLRNGRCVFRGA